MARLTTAVETYLTWLRMVRATGGATAERSNYGPLGNLLNAVGATLKPKTFCVGELADQGAGHPDFGLYAAKQIQRGHPKEGQLPERGVVEVKPADDDAWLTAQSDQISRYWDRYRLVLVTNTRDFILVGEDAAGLPVKLESFRLADNAEEFARMLETPRKFSKEVGVGLSEYLASVLSHRAVLTDPKDLAWLLASHAREALARVGAAGEAPSLTSVRTALEEVVGIRFEGNKGSRFFRSTLVQTLFYGVFSAWVIWARQDPPSTKSFNWREAAWYLRTPIMQTLFQQLSQPDRLQSQDLVEVLDWTSAALNRVDCNAFFARFNEGEAVIYFYEPFLEAFDPELRKQLGVWYTPTEVVRYMVARVDKALRDDLGIADGLAAENVYVLDPCCGTGAYLAEVLRRIAANLKNQGLGALTGARIKQAATERVFGFEIMPAPLVVAHLQVGLTMQELDAPLADDGKERAQIFLTNALTGWEPRTAVKLSFPEFEEERDRAERVKQKTPILVILGNPPYNGFAGMAVDEERELSDAYRETIQVRRPEGQGLNDLYIRFFRMAERRIAEKTGQGVVCFISNYSWLDGLSFTGMRERYLEVFDAIRIDCLNGDVRKGGQTPDGLPDPSIFTTDSSVGIQVGTAITTLVRKLDHAQAKEVSFRHLWGRAKPEVLMATAGAELNVLYDSIKPVLPLGLPFVQTAVSENWFNWPSLPDLFPVSFPGVTTSRDAFLVDIDIYRLKARISDYFNQDLNPDLNHEEIAKRYPAAMKKIGKTEPIALRDALIKRGGPNKTGFIRYAYRSFDNRWLYWEENNDLLGRPRPDYKPHVFEGNLWIEARQRESRETFSRGTLVRHIAGDFGNGRSHFFPIWLRDNDSGIGYHPNLSGHAHRYIDRLGIGVKDLFYHVLAVLHDTDYREANADALCLEWPRIPLPGWSELKDDLTEFTGMEDHAKKTLVASAKRGQELAQLLDSETPVPGVTTGTLLPEVAALAVPATTKGLNMTDDDFNLTEGWGHFVASGTVMPGRGRASERPFTSDERDSLADAVPTLGGTTFDIYLNKNAFWRNVPAAVWHYRLGGYQILKKWLSYRELTILERALTLEEVQYFTDTARRIGKLLLVSSKIPVS